MAEYGQRERRFNKSLPGHFANYTKGLVTADAEGKMQYLAFVKAILAEENVTIEQKISILTLKQPLSIGLSLPVAGGCGHVPSRHRRSNFEDVHDGSCVGCRGNIKRRKRQWRRQGNLWMGARQGFSFYEGIDFNTFEP